MPATFGMGSSRGLSAGGRRRPNPITQAYKVYNIAGRQQAEDYGDIMGGYKNLLSSAKGGVENLGELARTGGLSEADKANIRARGVSPIRAAYAGAEREVDRSRGLSGGYSPGYGALKARMAREQSQAMSDASRGVEADIAERVQSGRVSTSPTYAGMTPQAIGGQLSTYGTTPALVSTYGNLANQQAQIQAGINSRPRTTRRGGSRQAGLISRTYGRAA